MKHTEETKKRIGESSRVRGSAAIALAARWKNKITHCSVAGCEKKHHAKGYCEMHFARWKKHGSPGPVGYLNDKNENGVLSFYGYKLIKNIGEHVLAAEKILGKKLPSTAIVHHVNENKLDNSPTNLVICPDRNYHNLIHARMRALDKCGNANWLKCPFCGVYDDPKNMYVYPNKRAAKHVACFREYKKRWGKC